MNKLVNLQAEIKAVDDSTGHITGYASVFGGIDTYDDTIEPGAYASVIKSGRMPLMFFNHRVWDAVPIGKWNAWSEDAKGLYVEGCINLKLEKGREVYEAVKFKSFDGLSIGYSLTKDDFFIDEKKIRHIKNFSSVHEISLVTFPADDAARLTDIKSALDGAETIRDLEDCLRDLGMSKSNAVAFIAKAKQIVNQGEPDADLSEAAAKMTAIVNKLYRGN